MTIQEQIEKLKQDIKNTNELLSARLAALEQFSALQQLKKEQKSKVFIPSVDEEYWYLTSIGYTSDECDHDDGIINNFVEETIIRGHCFKTEKEVAWADKHRIVATELKHFVAKNDPNPIIEEDWENEEVAKYYIVYDNAANGVRIYTTGSYQVADQIYASNMETFEKAIAHIGEERLKKYYFGVSK